MGGSGGSDQNANAGAGGNATASVTLSGKANVSATASTTIAGLPFLNAPAVGQGGNVTGGSGFASGTGGNATANASATGTGSISGSSAVTSTANATGEAGGAPTGSGVLGNGAAGGAANANSTANSAGPDPEQATATALGGAGGAGAGSSFSSGNGGNATASATANSTSFVGTASASASATGGASSAPTSSAGMGIGGTASASATTNGVTILQVSSPGPSGAGGAASVGAKWTFSSGATVSVGTSSSNVNNGAVTVTGPSALIAGINGAGTLTVGNGSSPTLLRLTPSSGGSLQSALTINAGSSLDIVNNHLFITYGSNPDPISSIVGYLKTGFNGGSWNGPGIMSSAVALTHGYSLGYADSADPGNPAGLATGTIEIKYTLLGDANLEGSVTGDDFTILVGNLGKSGKSWDQGNFLYNSDNSVTGDDFTALVDNLGKSTTGADVSIPQAVYTAVDAYAAANGLMADVPEPASAGLLGLLTAGVLVRRRRYL